MRRVQSRTEGEKVEEKRKIQAKKEEILAARRKVLAEYVDLITSGDLSLTICSCLCFLYLTHFIFLEKFKWSKQELKDPRQPVIKETDFRQTEAINFVIILINCAAFDSIHNTDSNMPHFYFTA